MATDTDRALSKGVEALAALAHETRLDVFRLLVRAGPEGLAAGAIAAHAGVAPATLSFHLAQLERSGLLQSRRESRQVIYSIDQEGIRWLLEYLVEDCCQGNASDCATMLCDLPVLGCAVPEGTAAETAGKERIR